MFETTALYAVILVMLGTALSVRVSMIRASTGVSLGPGDSEALQVRMRQFGNFIENVPLVLIVMALAEAQGLSSLWLHAAGAILVAARVLHPFGLDPAKPATFARIAGSLGTRVATLIPVVAILRGLVGV